MPKKPSKTTQAKGPQPEPAQLKGVERLIVAGCRVCNVVCPSVL